MTRQDEPPAYGIRAGVPADIFPILSLERLIETAPHWSKADYQNCLDSTEINRIQRQLFVAECSTTGALHGFAVGKVVALGSGTHQEIEAELESVAVAVEARRLGIGRSLCIAIRDWVAARGAITLDLEVRSGSNAAIALYRSLGFSPHATRSQYYRDPIDDATLMRHILAPCPDKQAFAGLEQR